VVDTISSFNHSLTGEQYGKMEPKYTEGGHCQSVLRPLGILNVPLYFMTDMELDVLYTGIVLIQLIKKTTVVIRDN